MKSATDLAVEHWDETPLYISEEERYGFYPWLYDAAEFREHANEKVLEIGCGTGCDLLQFARHGATAVGIDVTPRHVQLARLRAKGDAEIHLSLANAGSLPFRDSSFDYVYSHGVLHHMDNPRGAVEEIFRVLRPEGRFNVMLYSRWSLAALEYLVRHGRRWRQHVENSTAPVHLDLYTARGMRGLFRPAQIEVRKYDCRRLPFLQRLFGWFIVARGRRPLSA